MISSSSSSSSSSTTTTTTTSTADQTDGTSIAAVPHDIITTHILTRLDGPTLASTACASPTLHTLCTEEKLWRDICASTWTSINDPRIQHVISAFPTGYRSFFSDSFPATLRGPPPHVNRPSPIPELISAIDIWYKNKIIFSKVEITETVRKDFLDPPLWIDLLRREEKVPVPAPAPAPTKFEANNDGFFSDLEESMRLSWILIDPTQNRSVNLSSQRPVSVERHYTPEEVQLTYVTVLPGSSRVGSSDPVQCRIMVTCGGEEGGEMHVREVNMQVQDMDGFNLSGEDSLVILQGAMGCERRMQVKGRERYEEFLEMKRERRKRIERREKRVDLVCLIIRVIIFVILLYGLLG
ncbi:hypothetical protein LguiA_012454 [Lonicera macranthoides]